MSTFFSFLRIFLAKLPFNPKKLLQKKIYRVILSVQIQNLRKKDVFL